MFISHDVHFIKTLANKVIHVAGGKLTHYMGDYEFYLHKTQSTSARAALTAGGQKESKKAGRDAKRAAKNDSGSKAKADNSSPRAVAQKQKKVVQKLEEEIEAVERRQAKITVDLERPETWSNSSRSAEINKEMVASRARLDELTSQWELEAARLEEAAS